jgi:hypothetical protein
MQFILGFAALTAAVKLFKPCMKVAFWMAALGH